MKMLKKSILGTYPRKCPTPFRELIIMSCEREAVLIASPRLTQQTHEVTFAAVAAAGSLLASLSVAIIKE